MMAMRPVTGLVLNYRDPNRTTACVQALLDAGVSKVLVFDNSGPGVGRMAIELPASIGNADVDVVFSERNLGFSAGVNRGLVESAARWPSHWVLLVNNDALVPAGLPERLAGALSADATAATAFPCMLQDGIRIGWAWYQPWFGLITLGPLPGSFHYASGCCQLIAPERVGNRPFDEDFFMYGEDIELAWRLAQGSLRQLLVEGCEVVHEGSASSQRGSLFYETLLVESHVRLASKLSRGRVGRHAILLVLRAVSLPVRAVLRAARSRSLAPLRGLFLGARRAFRSPSAYA